MGSGWATGVATGLLNSVNNNIEAQRNQEAQNQELGMKDQLNAFQQASKEYDDEKRDVGKQGDKMRADAELIAGSDNDPNALALAYQYNSTRGYGAVLKGDDLGKLQQQWQVMKDNPDLVSRRSAPPVNQDQPNIPSNINPQSMQQFGVPQDRLNEVYGSRPSNAAPNDLIPPTDDQINKIRERISSEMPGASPSPVTAQSTVSGSVDQGQANDPMAVDASAVQPQPGAQPQSKAGIPPPPAAGQVQPPASSGGQPDPGISLSGPAPAPQAGPASMTQPPAPQDQHVPPAPVSEAPPKNYHYPAAPTDRWVKGVNVGAIDAAKPEVADAARAMIEGRASPTAYQLRNSKDPNNPWPEAQRLALKADPGFSTFRAAQVKQAMLDFGTDGDTGKSIGAMNTALTHLGNLDDAIKALDNNNVPALNRIANQYSVQTGGPAVKVFEAIQKRVSTEMASAYKANPTLEEIRSAEGDIGTADSANSLRAVPRTLATLLSGRIQTNESKWDDIMGKDSTQPRVHMSPQAKVVYDRLTADKDNLLGSKNGLDIYSSRVDGKKFALPHGSADGGVSTPPQVPVAGNGT